MKLFWRKKRAIQDEDTSYHFKYNFFKRDHNLRLFLNTKRKDKCESSLRGLQRRQYLDIHNYY